MTGTTDGTIYPSTDKSGNFLDYTKVIEATKNKFNLAPRKYWETVETGSDYGELREKMDDVYMDKYQSSFIPTTDG